MEKLQFEFADGVPADARAVPVLVGVVSSGNLEVLVEPAALSGACHIEVSTAARGFHNIWEAVLRDFFERWRLGDIVISINDVGATPAVVSLRLDQAVEEFNAPKTKP
jgi:malonate decarboxylase delta subunit